LASGRSFIETSLGESALPQWKCAVIFEIHASLRLL
jgi:hypothetical protein